MNITAVKSDSANVLVTAKIDKADIEKNINKTAKQLAKTQQVDGFRKGKVPVSIVKRMHGEKLQEEAESDAVSEIIKKAKIELKIKDEDIVGEPVFKKYQKSATGIDVQLEISLKPTIKADDYKKLAPTFKKPVVKEEEIKERIDTLLENNTPYKKLKKERPLAKNDKANFDFVGKINGKEFEGGSAEKFELVIGSGQFIPGFEDQMVGMKAGETKDIKVTFPKDYQSEDLAGKEAVFTVKLHSIKARGELKLDKEMVKRLLPGKEDATVETVKEQVKEQIKSEKLSKLYNEELKPKLIEALVTKYNFDLPNNIVEQEIDAQVNQKAQEMSEKELEEYRKDPKKLEKLRESLREDAKNSVKATFLVDALAKKENVVVEDQEVTQTIYYEAMMSGQEPQEVIKYYQENNLLPAIKMGMIEDKLFSKILGLDK
jgi:trigger factor